MTEAQEGFGQDRKNEYLALHEKPIKRYCMRSVFLYLVLAMMGVCLLSASCKKGSGGGGDPTPPPAPTEANLTVDLDPANGSVQAPALPPFNLKVTVTSAMPPNGVKIEVTGKKDDGSGTQYFTTSVNSTTAVNTINITSTPVGVQCLVEVKVTSLTKATNVWTGSYRYSSK